jgi:hypothetical protein
MNFSFWPVPSIPPYLLLNFSGDGLEKWSASQATAPPPPKQNASESKATLYFPGLGTATLARDVFKFAHVFLGDVSNREVAAWAQPRCIVRLQHVKSELAKQYNMSCLTF